MAELIVSEKLNRPLLFPLNPDLEDSFRLEDDEARPLINFAQFMPTEPPHDLIAAYSPIAWDLTKRARLTPYTPPTLVVTQLPMIYLAATHQLTEAEILEVRCKAGLLSTDNPVGVMKEIVENAGLDLYYPEFITLIPDWKRVDRDFIGRHFGQYTDAAIQCMSYMTQYLQLRALFDIWGTNEEQRRLCDEGIKIMYGDTNVSNYESEIGNQLRKNGKSAALTGFGMLARFQRQLGHEDVAITFEDALSTLLDLTHVENSNKVSDKQKLDNVRLHELVFHDVVTRYSPDVTEECLVT